MAESVKVIVRCRPMNKQERELKCKSVVTMDTSVMQVSLVSPNDRLAPPKVFTFDAVYGESSQTESIYKDMAYPLVEGVLEGYNGTIFAYGQTGCGKSYTMQGVQDPPTQLGLLPRAFEHIFDVICTAQDTRYLIHSSFLEIYNEEVRDLLSNDSKKKLDLKEHPDRGVYINNLSKNPCHDSSDCEKLMQKGWSNRSVGETLMNKDSSRSHSIFTIYIEMITSGEENNRNQIRAGKLNLVDLAGSERQAKTGASGDRLKEATKINLSLSALGNVISSLVDGKSKHIPYRDSKLTRLLQDSLGGNTKTMMVACVSPADNNYDESLSTLRYANRAKQIRNKPVINEDPKDTLLREYQNEIRLLREQLHMAATPGISALTDNNLLEAEKKKLKQQFDQEMTRLKQALDDQKKELLIRDSGLQDTESQTAKIRREFEQREKAMRDDFERQKHLLLQEKLGGVSESSVIEKLQLLESQMVGGELANNQQALQKRRQASEEVQRRRREIAAAHSRNATENADESELLVRAYDDVQSTLRARTELAKKMKVKLRAQEQEIGDIQHEFAVERGDYLETIRRQQQQLQLLQQLLERVQPLVRRDCNYADMERVRSQSVWDESEQRWRIPELKAEKTTLPPAGLSSFLTASTLKGGSPDAVIGGGVQASRTPTSQTAPARLAVGWNEDEDKFLKKLEKSAIENIAGQYFKPTGNRQAEILSKTKRLSEDKFSTDDFLSPTSSTSGSPSGSQHVLDSSQHSWSSNKNWLGLATFPTDTSLKLPTRLAPVQEKKKNLNTLDLI